MTSQLTWYVARAGGLVAWGVAAASVLWGLALSTRALGRRPRPAWLFDLHRFLGGLALIFTVVHVTAILLDGYVHFGIMNVLVPFTGSWRPVAVAWGIVAFYLALSVELTSLARSRVGPRLWRTAHYGAFGLFWFGTVHALTAGTDAGSTPVLAVIAGVSVVVSAMTAVRVFQALSPGRSNGRTVPVARPLAPIRSDLPLRPDLPAA